jgi:hypothetical protein
MRKACGVNIIIMDESSEPTTETVPPGGGDGGNVALPSFPFANVGSRACYQSGKN